MLRWDRTSCRRLLGFGVAGLPFFILHHGQDGSGCLECGFCAALHEFFHLISLVGQTAQAAKKCRMICQVLNVFVHIHAAGFLGFFGLGRFCLDFVRMSITIPVTMADLLIPVISSVLRNQLFTSSGAFFVSSFIPFRWVMIFKYDFFHIQSRIKCEKITKPVCK